MNATTAIPNPGKRLRNIVRFENTGLLRQASRFAQGSRNSGVLDMLTWVDVSGDMRYTMLLSAHNCCRRRRMLVYSNRCEMGNDWSDGLGQVHSTWANSTKAVSPSITSLSLRGILPLSWTHLTLTRTLTQILACTFTSCLLTLQLSNALRRWASIRARPRPKWARPNGWCFHQWHL